jgi:cytochrome c oxidase cbb3-type subunit 3
MAPVYAKYAQHDRPSSWPRTRRPWASASACSSTTARSATAPTAAAARASRTWPTDWLGRRIRTTTIKETIARAAGHDAADGRGVGTAEDVKNVANYVLSLSGSAHNDVAAQLGKAKFAVCAACHGPEGKGNMALGAPNLTDKIWLHGWGEKTIVAMVTNGKTNVMPAQGRLLTQEQIHVLGAYVWNLSKTTRVAGN